MSRRQPLNLPEVPEGLPGADIPQTDPTMETLKSMRQQYSKEWFDLYDTMSQPKRAQYNRELLTKIKRKQPRFSYEGLLEILKNKRKQANSVYKMQQTLSQFEPTPTEKPVAAPMPRTTAAFTIPPDVFKQCQKLKKEIETYFEYTKDVEKFPEVDKKYRPKFFEELEKLRNRINSECLLRGQVPEREEFFKNMNELLGNMMTEMMADPRYAAIRQAKQRRQGAQGRQGGKRRTRKHKRKAKGKTRKYHKKKHRKRKTRKSTN